MIKRRPWRRQAESQAPQAARETEQDLGLEQPIAGHAGKWEWALCCRREGTRSAVGGTGTATGTDNLSLLACWQAERAERGSHSVNSSKAEARQARMMRFMGGW